MKWLFINPPVVKGVAPKAPDRNFGCNYGIYFQQPIHILYPATLLKTGGQGVEFMDAPVEGINEAETLKLVGSQKFDVYVFFTVFLSQELDQYWAKKIRELHPGAWVIFMGPEVSYKADQFVKDERMLVVRGEPEQTMKELARAFGKAKPRLGAIKGLSWMRDGKIVNNPERPPMSGEDLDRLPFPDRSLLKVPDRYYNVKLQGRPSTTMLTSRGCSYRCIFCIPSAYTFAREIEFKLKHKFNKPSVAMRSPENVVKEFEEIKKAGYRSVAIMDDNFVWSNARMMEIARGMTGLGLEWGCLARANFLQDDEMLRAMKKAGCVYVDIGVESFDQKVLDYVKKDIRVEVIMTAVEKLKKAGIEPKINILIGASPLQTRNDLKQTVDILKKMDVKTVSFSIVIPHPMTRFYQMVREQEWFATRSGDFEPADTYREGTVNFPELSHADLEQMVKWAYRKFYLRPGYVWKRLKEVGSLRQLVEMSRSAIKLFVGM